MNTVEVRCPVGPKKLFTKLKLGEEFATHVAEGNLIEFTCSDCARKARREGSNFYRIYHSFNFIGELVSTRVELLWMCRRPPCSRDEQCCARGAFQAL